MSVAHFFCLDVYLSVGVQFLVLYLIVCFHIFFLMLYLMATRKKVVRNSTTKKRKTFIYSHDKSIADKQFVQLFLPVLQKSSKWNFQEFNKNKMYDFVNSKHNSVFSNNSYINNYV